MLEHDLDEPIPGFIITCELGGCQCLMERKLIFFFKHSSVSEATGNALLLDGVLVESAEEEVTTTEV